MIQVRTDGKGRRRYRVRYESGGRELQRTFARLEDARAYERAVKDRARSGDLVVASRADRQRPVASFWAEVLEHRPLERRTRARYEELWRLHVEPTWGRMPMVSVNGVDVRAWVRRLGVSRAPATVAQALTVLSLACGEAVAQGVRSENPARGCRPRQGAKPQGPALTLVQVARLVQCASAVDGPMFLLAAVTGLRFGELAGLQVGDIDVARCVVAVERTVIEVGGRQEVKAYPKGGATSRRVVGVPPSVLDELSPLMEAGGSTAWLWPNSRGGPRWYRSARASMTAATKRAGMIPVGLHALRRTAATANLQVGTPLRDVQAMLGHKSPIMTMRYAVADVATQTEGATKVAALIAHNTDTEMNTRP